MEVPLPVVLVEGAAAEHVRHEDVQVPVAVVVEHCHVSRPAGAREPGLRGRVHEPAVPGVAVEAAGLARALQELGEVRRADVVLALRLVRLERPAGRVRHEEVEEAVAVGVEEGRGLRVGHELQARRLRDVLERAVAAVAEEDVASPRRRDVEVLVPVPVGAPRDERTAAPITADHGLPTTALGQDAHRNAVAHPLSLRPSG